MGVQQRPHLFDCKFSQMNAALPAALFNVLRRLVFDKNLGNSQRELAYCQFFHKVLLDQSMWGRRYFYNL